MNNISDQINYWAHMLDESIDDGEISVISDIGEFLDLCKEKGEDIKKAKAKKQGKVVNATKGYALVCNDKDGKDISPVAPDVFNDKTLWLNESKAMKYTRKQIRESIMHWQKVLESLNESIYGKDFIEVMTRWSKPDGRENLKALSEILSDLNKEYYSRAPQYAGAQMLARSKRFVYGDDGINGGSNVGFTLVCDISGSDGDSNELGRHTKDSLKKTLDSTSKFFGEKLGLKIEWNEKDALDTVNSPHPTIWSEKITVIDEDRLHRLMQSKLSPTAGNAGKKTIENGVDVLELGKNRMLQYDFKSRLHDLVNNIWIKMNKMDWEDGASKFKLSFSQTEFSLSISPNTEKALETAKKMLKDNGLDAEFEKRFSGGTEYEAKSLVVSNADKLLGELKKIVRESARVCRKNMTIESFTYNPTENIFEDDGKNVRKAICVYSAEFERDIPYCRGVASREGDDFVDAQVEAETEKSETFEFPAYLNVNVPGEIGAEDFESVRDKIEEYALDAFNEANDFKFVKAVSLEFDDNTDGVLAESEDPTQTSKNIRGEYGGDYYEGDFPAWALDYVVNGEVGSVSWSEKQMIDGWFATLHEQGYDTTMISYGEDEYFSSRPEFGLACDCVDVKVYKAQSR